MWKVDRRSGLQGGHDASFNSSLWIFIMNCLTHMNVDQLCPVGPYMMMEMFSIYIVLFGSHQSDVATEYV